MHWRLAVPLVSLVVLVAVLGLLAVGGLAGDQARPAVDRAAPRRTEMATFALG